MNGQQPEPYMNERGSSLIELMISLTILGFVITGSYSGMSTVLRQTTTAEQNDRARRALELAVLDLDNLPGNSPRLADDGDASDLGDLATPDFTSNGAAPWTLDIDGTQFGIFYNVGHGLDLPNTTRLRVFAVWSASNGDPFAAPRDHHHTRSVEIVRGLF